jgi:hypothetical protein
MPYDDVEQLIVDIAKVKGWEVRENTVGKWISFSDIEQAATLKDVRIMVENTIQRIQRAREDGLLGLEKVEVEDVMEDVLDWFEGSFVLINLGYELEEFQGFHREDGNGA